jgi:hypothetical protein
MSSFGRTFGALQMALVAANIHGRHIARVGRKAVARGR